MNMVLQHNQLDSRFLSLPSELIEHTLVCTSILGFPEAIAAAAQTCRDMRALIYGASDQHLWREIYLSVFDDPRPGIQIDRRDLGPTQSQPRAGPEDIDFDWGAEFRQRVWAANYISRSTGTSANNFPSSQDSMQIMTSNLNALEALLSAVHTADPFPPAIVQPPLSPSSNADAYISPQSYPIFPPPPEAYYDQGPSCYWPSRNIEWLQSTLANGLPPSLQARLSGTVQSGGSHALWQSQIESRMMRALGRLTASTGFRSIAFDGDGQTSVLPEVQTTVVTAVQNRDNDDGGEDDEGDSEGSVYGTETGESTSEGPETREESVQTESSPVLPLDMSAKAQQTRARRLARMRVYNMRYLDRERHWGPFLLPPSIERCGTPPANDNDILDPNFAIIVDHDAGHPNADDENDPNPPAPVQSAAPPPGPEKLRADWAYLGAVRVVVESNLRESVGPESGLDGLLWLEGLRRGSAPTGDHEDDPHLEPPRINKGKGKQKDPEEVMGWDWAGVDGIWRRCVCWMDYRDLIRECQSLFVP